jgi:TetR/AcrR family acrAB operon transcriptional repressor
LLDAAECVFRAKGVAHATLADVAHAAGLTRGAVYWHFRDKAALFQAMCERAALPMEAMMDCRGGREATLDPLGILRNNAVQGLLRLAHDPRTQAVFDVVFHKCEFTEEMAPVVDRQRTNDEGCRRHVVELLDHAVVMGQLPHDTDTRLAAEMLKAFMLGVMHEWVRNPDSHPLAQTAPVMIDTFLAGLTVRPPRTGRTTQAAARTARMAAAG